MNLQDLTFDQNRAKQINTIGDKTVPKRHKKTPRSLEIGVFSAIY